MTTTVPDRKQVERDRFIDSLRQIVDFLDSHPDVPKPSFLITDNLHIYLHGDDQRAQLARIARAMGRAEKAVDGERFKVSRKFGALTLIAEADRAQVCERVVVGTREVTEEVPDPQAVAALPKVTVTKVVEDVEWVCPPALLADPAPAVDDKPVQTWWFTFGEGHTTTGGASLAGNYVRLTGTCDGARALMHSLFGNQWCDQYPSAERAGVQEFGLVEYMVGAQS